MESTPARATADKVLDITLRVGCRLAYVTTGSASLVLNLNLRPGSHHAVLVETLSLGNQLPFDEHQDFHGNRVLRVELAPGTNEIVHDALVKVSSRPDNHELIGRLPSDTGKLPMEVLRYTLPSRYCDSDRLTNFAWQQFGHIEHGWPRVQAISEWVHRNIEYRYLSGRPDLSAGDILQRGYGVCRDFAHLNIALNRTFNVPARYITGHIPDIGVPDPEQHMDFHAYAEVYLGGNWLTTDARFHVPRIGRITVSRGLDAVDGAFSTIYGGATLSYFQVWAYQIVPGSVNIGDPVDLSKRIDNRREIQTGS
jgi:transglutaminase-like putative cysteine protease